MPVAQTLALLSMQRQIPHISLNSRVLDRYSARFRRNSVYSHSASEVLTTKREAEWAFKNVKSIGCLPHMKFCTRKMVSSSKAHANLKANMLRSFRLLLRSLRTAHYGYLAQLHWILRKLRARRSLRMRNC